MNDLSFNNYAIYNSSGMITKLIGCTSNLIYMQIKSDEMFVEGRADIDLHYVVDGKIVNRPENPAYCENLTLYDVPTPSKIIIDFHEYEVDSSTVHLDLVTPGTYHIEVRSFPHKNKVIEVVV